MKMRQTILQVLGNDSRPVPRLELHVASMRLYVLGEQVAMSASPFSIVAHRPDGVRFSIARNSRTIVRSIQRLMARIECLVARRQPQRVDPGTRIACVTVK